MKPQEFFHDNPVIDKRPDGTYLYFHKMPSILLKGPRIIIPPDDIPPDQDTSTTE